LRNSGIREQSEVIVRAIGLLAEYVFPMLPYRKERAHPLVGYNCGRSQAAQQAVEADGRFALAA